MKRHQVTGDLFQACGLPEPEPDPVVSPGEQVAPNESLPRPYMPVKAKREDYGTPEWIFQPLHKEFVFTLDAAASSKNNKCKRFYDKEQDGAFQDWRYDTVFVNPPYNINDLTKFAMKAAKEAIENGVTTALLYPCKTDQDWFHALIALEKHRKLSLQIRYIKGRVKYVGAPTGATFSSFVIIVQERVFDHIRVSTIER